MPRAVSWCRGLLVTAGGFAVVASVGSALSACNAFLDDFVYVDASVPPVDGTIPPADDGGADVSVLSLDGGGDGSTVGSEGGETDGDGGDGGDDDGSDGEAGGRPLSYVKSVLLATPVAYWRLGESGGDIAVTLEGEPMYNALYTDDVTLGVPGAIDGDPDTAIHLSGDPGSVLLAGGLPFTHTTSFSVELWMRPTVAATGQSTVLIKESDSTSVVQLSYVDSNSSTLQLTELRNGVESIDHAFADPVVLAWNYVVAIQNGSQLTLFLNNQQVATTAIAGDAGTGGDGGTFSIGGDANGDGAFTGDIDEVAVYSKVLTAEQMSIHYSLAGPHDAGP